MNKKQSLIFISSMLLFTFCSTSCDANPNINGIGHDDFITLKKSDPIMATALGNGCTHEFTNFVSNNDASCLHNGTKTAKCDKCEETLTISDENTKLPHNYNKQVIDNKYLCNAGDCEHKAKYFYSCECGQIGNETFEYGDTEAHNFDDPIEFEINKVKYVCKDCGATKVDDRYKDLTIYATNDLHPKDTLTTINGKNLLVKIGTYFKEKSQLPNTLLLDAGDTWKGGADSNLNKGALVTEVFNYAHFDARSIGNHDFNWGRKYIERNTAADFEGYSVPVLATNVFDYDPTSQTYGNIHQDKIGREYITYTLENDLKVGIVGLIPEYEIDTIVDNMIHDYGFKDYVEVGKSVCEKLRTVEHCDLVIGSFHQGVKEIKAEASVFSTISPNTHEKYCDLMLCSHTHQFESEFLNNVLLVQCHNGFEEFRNIKMTYDLLEQKVIKVIQEPENFKEYSVSSIDPKLQGILEKYKTQFDNVFSEEIFTASSNFDFKTSNSLLSKAIYDVAHGEGYTDVSYSIICGGTGSKLGSGNIKFSNIFDFANQDYDIYIAEIKGSYLRDFFTNMELDNFDNGLVTIHGYRGTTSDALIALDDSKTYTVAIEDTLLFHIENRKDEKRVFDFFPEFNIVGTITDSLNNNCYRDLLTNYVNGKTLNPSSFSGNHYLHKTYQQYSNKDKDGVSYNEINLDTIN